MLPQDTTHLIQRPCYRRGSPCQHPAGKRTTRRPLDHRKETQTAEVWSCLPFIGSGQNHLARHSESGKKTRQTEEEVGRQHQGMDRPRVRQSQRAVENREKWRKLVAKSSVVPQRPSRLKDRWERDDEMFKRYKCGVFCLGNDLYHGVFSGAVLVRFLNCLIITFSSFSHYYYYRCCCCCCCCCCCYHYSGRLLVRMRRGPQKKKIFTDR